MTKKKMETVHVGQGFQELEGIVQWFEKGEMDLDEGMKKFERAMELAKALRKRIEEAEQQIRDVKQSNV